MSFSPSTSRGRSLPTLDSLVKDVLGIPDSTWQHCARSIIASAGAAAAAAVRAVVPFEAFAPTGLDTAVLRGFCAASPTSIPLHEVPIWDLCRACAHNKLGRKDVERLKQIQNFRRRAANLAVQAWAKDGLLAEESTA